MLITKKNFDSFLKAFDASRKNDGVNRWATDLETTGIWWWKTPHVSWYTPRIFSMQFSSASGEDYYLDFNHSDDKLDDADMARVGREVYADPEIYWFDHNAKFELHHARNHGIEFAGTVHCTKHIARVANNVEEDLKLDALCAKYFGTPKIDVKTFIEENKLYTLVDRFGARLDDEPEKWLHFDKLPLKMLVDYGKLDTRLCFNLGIDQLKKIQLADETYYKTAQTAKLSNVLHNENKLTKTSFEMERVGIKLDLPYCTEAYNHERTEYEGIKAELNALITPEIKSLLKEKNEAEHPNWNSAHHIKTIFEALGEKSVKLTSKGKMSFDKEALEAMNAPAAKQVLQYRYHYKRAHTYFQNFIWLADTNNIIHCDIQNSGPETGRQSIWNPNLQNIPKRRDKDEARYKVRKCFICRSEEGFFFMDKDYSGAEFSMAMDYAKELPVIEQIKNGLDPHKFTLEKFRAHGIDLKDRDTAKTMTFRLIYGAGNETVGKAVGFKPGWEAKTKGKVVKEAYFKLFPAFESFMKNVQSAARQRGYVYNWLGRLLTYVNVGGFGVENWFKSPNGVIQSGIGDTLKVAMNEIAELLRGKKSRMLIPVHDAILFEIHTTEKYLIPLIDAIMAKAFPAKLLPLTTDAGYTRSDWASLVDEIPA